MSCLPHFVGIIKENRRMSKENIASKILVAVREKLATIDIEPYTTIHPAIDFKENKAYVGLALPYRGHRGTRQMLPYFVTNEEMFEINDEELGKRRIALENTDLPSDPSRWSTKGIAAYFNNKEETSPEQLYQTIKDTILAHIDFQDKRYYDLVTIWNIGTYFFPLFDAYPYLHVNGVSDSGKTQLMKVCQCIAFNAELSGSISAAALFRKVQATRCTLLIDENEELANPIMNEELYRLLLNGYKRGAKVMRSDMRTPGYIPMKFDVYSPKMLASISVFERVLGSRCISIIMQPSSNKEIAGKAVKDSDTSWQDIRNMLYPFLLNNWGTIYRSYDELRNDFDLANRDYEIWKPILAMARLFSNDIFKDMVVLAHEKAEERRMEKAFTPEAELATALLSTVDKDDFYHLGEIKDYIAADYGNKVPSWITEKNISSLLKKFGFSKIARNSKGYKFFLTVAEVKKIAENFGIIDEHNEHSADATGRA